MLTSSPGSGVEGEVRYSFSHKKLLIHYFPLYPQFPGAFQVFLFVEQSSGNKSIYLTMPRPETPKKLKLNSSMKTYKTF